MSPRRQSRTAQQFIRPLIQRLHPYVPGEQPKIKGLIKLNTNETPYPPSPKVLAAIKKSADARLRLYPNPTAEPLREKLAKLHGCKPENIIVGNGSDELLAIAVRAFVEPLSPARSSLPRGLLAKSLVQFFHPSYSLYPVLASIHGAKRERDKANSSDERTEPAIWRAGPWGANFARGTAALQTRAPRWPAAHPSRCPR